MSHQDFYYILLKISWKYLINVFMNGTPGDISSEHFLVICNVPNKTHKQETVAMNLSQSKDVQNKLNIIPRVCTKSKCEIL